MIKLNLVPEYIKEEQKLNRILNLNTKVLLFLGFSIVVSSLITLYSRYALEKMNIEYVAQDTLISNNAKEYNSKVKQINDRINTISKIQLENFEWPTFLANFANLIPTNISISSASFNHNTDMISISGLAKQRDDLLELKSNLVSSGIINTFEFPISTMLQKENIKFEITSQANFTATSTIK